MGRRKFLIVMGAGSGTRMGADKPKQFLELGGKAILQKTIEVFTSACPDIAVITVLPEAYIDYWKDYCYRRKFTCPQILVKGGITRFHSVKNALEKVPSDAIVAVHDGVRPLITCDMVARMFEEAESVPALIPVVPCVDTMKVLIEKSDSAGRKVLTSVPGRTVDRSELFGAQTPQMFHSELLKDAYSLAYDTAFTDDASVVEKYGKSLSYTIGERLNIKITTQDDLILAQAVMSVRGA